MVINLNTGRTVPVFAFIASPAQKIKTSHVDYVLTEQKHTVDQIFGKTKQKIIIFCDTKINVPPLTITTVTTGLRV